MSSICESEEFRSEARIDRRMFTMSAEEERVERSRCVGQNALLTEVADQTSTSPHLILSSLPSLFNSRFRLLTSCPFGIISKPSQLSFLSSGSGSGRRAKTDTPSRTTALQHMNLSTRPVTLIDWTTTVAMPVNSTVPLIVPHSITHLIGFADGSHESSRQGHLHEPGDIFLAADTGTPVCTDPQGSTLRRHLLRQ